MTTNPYRSNIYKAKVDKVVDGDTIVATIDLGFHASIQERFRLARMNAPELKGEEREQGLLAKAALEDLIAECNSEVQIRSLGKDRYGYIADIVATGTLKNLSDHMIYRGFAKEY